MSPRSPITPRLHILPDALARSPGHIAERLPPPAAALFAAARLLQPLPPPLLDSWLAAEDGHIVIGPLTHGFSPGPNAFRDRMLDDIAWLRLAYLVDDPITFLAPAGQLIHFLILNRFRPDIEPTPIVWRQFQSGLQSCFHAGYGRSIGAQQDADLYLGEGIAWYLADRRGLNLADPRLEKLLTATLFDASFYLYLGRRAGRS